MQFSDIKNIPETKEQKILDLKKTKKQKKTGKYKFEWILQYTKFPENSV